MFSGGIGSWGAARRVADRFQGEPLTLLFTDTLIEDPDLYRFLQQAAADVAGELVWLKEGRTPWEVFRDERYLGNTRADPCSKILKRQMADRWLAANCEPNDTIVYVGIDWTEEHRFTRLRDRRAESGWTYQAPLCEQPLISKADLFASLRSRGIDAPRLYALGFSHNNCGGGCVKAGIGHFARLLDKLPDVFADWEANEATLRAQLGDVSILRDRTGGQVKPLTLVQLRRRIEGGQQPDLFEIGGCGCFVDVEEEAA